MIWPNLRHKNLEECPDSEFRPALVATASASLPQNHGSQPPYFKGPQGYHLWLGKFLKKLGGQSLEFGKERELLGFIVWGVLLNPGLLVSKQVGAFHQLQLVNQLWLFLGTKDLAIVEQALVTPRLYYCNLLYMGLPLKSVQLHWLPGSIQGVGIDLQSPAWPGTNIPSPI